MLKRQSNRSPLSFVFVLVCLQLGLAECRAKSRHGSSRSTNVNTNQWDYPSWLNFFFPGFQWPQSWPTPQDPVSNPPISNPPPLPPPVPTVSSVSSRPVITLSSSAPQSTPVVTSASAAPVITPPTPAQPTTTSALSPPTSAPPQPQPTSTTIFSTTTSAPPQPNPTSTSVFSNSTSLPSPTSSSTVSTPTGKPGSACSTLRVRKEWRTLSRQEQINYIQAVKCLAKLPSKLLPGGNYRRYDDFENVHSRMRNKIHWIASFLPWHRHFLFLYEQALQKECGYTGNLPRWDWTQDSADVTQSPVFSADPDVGFGSNGMDFSDNSDGLDAGTVEDGAFANWKLYYPDEHLLQRNYNLPDDYQQQGRKWGSQFFDAKSVATVQSQKTYAKFAVALEGTDPNSNGPSNPGPHSIIHVIIGGDISPTAYAANEPLFYLHHSNVDSHWEKWQNSQRSSRLNAYGGQATRGSGKNDAKLTDRLAYLGLSDDITVSQAMDTYSYPYCYRYES